MCPTWPGQKLQSRPQVTQLNKGHGRKPSLQRSGVERRDTKSLVINTSAEGLAQMIERHRVEDLLDTQTDNFLIRIEGIGGRCEAISDELLVKLKHRPFYFP